MKAFVVRSCIGILFSLMLLAHAAKIVEFPFITVLDHYLYDVRVRLFAKEGIDDRIVIVDIDERSLAAIGHWPWGRNKVADLVRRLNEDYHAAVIGFDIVFAEADDSSGLTELERLGQHELRDDKRFRNTLNALRSKLDYDQLFTERLKQSPSVLGYYFSNQQNARQGGQLPLPVFGPGSLASFAEQFVRWEGYGANLPHFQKAAASAGFFNPMVDFDGSIRRVPILVEHAGAYYEALSVAMVRTVLGKTELEAWAASPDSAIEAINIVTPRGTLSIPVDGDTSALVPYRGSEGGFTYVSAVDVLEGKVDPNLMLGRIMLIGTTAPGLNDLRTTPVGSSYPGVEIHANLIAGILDGSISEKPAYLTGANIVMLIVVALTLITFLPRLSPLKGAFLAIILLASMIGINLAFWHYFNTVLPLACVLLAIFGLYGFNTAWGYFIESRSKRQFTELFGQYVPPELVDKMAQNPEQYSMEGRNQELTVLFSDVRSFTTISEGLDPKELTHLMNAYLDAMTKVIQQHQGTLDKYIGDAIMAFWGAPVENPHHTRQALLAALGMQTALRRLDDSFKERGWPCLQIGIGINTGIMTVGDMGSQIRRAYTVMGDAVNLGARLEGISKEYGVGIVVGESCLPSCPDFAFRELDRVRVKGKDAPVTIYEPLGLISEQSPETLHELAMWTLALEEYRAQNWNAAEASIRDLIALTPNRPLYTLYLARIAQLRTTPPEDANWDGVTTFKTK
ncbi:adenylate/guanylate cyclase domain-containing protein [Dechloromonas sp. ZS-1]|uniref:CHASE2 domain-containing protein n=1 Tax=Dechloromonas sp. ZS-1 TaxID=3138067 RepID=UPI0031FC1426